MMKTNTKHTIIRVFQVLLCFALLSSCSNKEETEYFPSDSYLKVTKSIYFSGDGETKQFDIESHNDWNITNLPSWLSASPTSGSGSVAVTLTAQANTSSKENRTATFSVVSGDLSFGIDVTQSTKTPTLSVSPTVLTATAKSQTLSLAITSETSWTASIDNSSWCEIDKTSGDGDGSLTVTTHDNTSTDSRSAVITITSQQQTVQCTLTQAAATMPTAATPVQTSTTKNSITLASSYSSEFPVTEYGFVYSTSNSTPALSDSKVSLTGSATSGNINATITDLTSGTKYYIRAYATSAVGTAYSSTIEVTTSGSIPGEGDNPTPQM